MTEIGVAPASRVRLAMIAPVLALLACVLAAIGLAALSLPDDQATHADPVTSAAPPGAPPIAALPAAPEEPDPTPSSALSPADARSRNAAVPFAITDPAPARPFAFGGNAADRTRATYCLALAAMAEAGASPDGQRAVIQVVLNRVRHPAFAKTVCGVVFQGSERRTGCQFTFTCDGSLARPHTDAAWTASRRRAGEALGGRVFAPVGNATHYHTDWVYPWWSGELDKIARVDTHLFFRWRGYWGTPAAQRIAYRGGEPEMDGAADPEAADDATDAEGVAGVDATGAVDSTPDVAAIETSPLPPNRDAGRIVGRFAPATDAAVPGTLSASPSRPPSNAQAGANVHFIGVGANDAPPALADRARRLCRGTMGFCQVFGWSEAEAIPERLPLPDTARRKLRFSFASNTGGGGETLYYDCRLFEGVAKARCLPAAQR